MVLYSSKLSSRFKRDKGILKSSHDNEVNDTVNISEISEEKDIILSNNSSQSVITDLADVEKNLRKALLEKISSIPVWADYDSEKQKDLIRTFLLNASMDIPSESMPLLVDSLYNSILGFGPLEDLIKKDNVSSVIVNGTKNVYIEIAGKILNTEIALSEEQIKLIINNILSISGKKAEKLSDIWSCTIQNLLISVISSDIASSGTVISIRKFPDYNIDSLLSSGIMPREIFDFLISAIDMKKNIVISGEINSGKTLLIGTIINSMMLNKRGVLLQEMPQICLKSGGFMNFFVKKSQENFPVILSELFKMMPDYMLIDLNSYVQGIAEKKGVILSLRSSSVNDAFSKLVSSIMVEENCTEKYAKHKVLDCFDYIIQINNIQGETPKLTSVVELTPARTASLSIKTIAKLVDGEYVMEIPQPLTSIRAESLISESGLKSSRFYKTK